MATQVHPRYVLTYVGPKALELGDSRSLTWWLSRVDGLPVAAPSAVINIMDATGALVVTAATVDVAASGANVTQVLAYVFVPAAQGPFSAKVSVAIADSGDSQTVSDEQIIVVS